MKLTQSEINFMQEAMYAKCDNVLQKVVDSVNAQIASEKQPAEEKPKTTKKGETK